MRVARPGADFIVSTELECMVTIEGGEHAGSELSALERLIGELARLAPSLYGPAGLFNGYGRVYVDCGHLELAACECATPYELVSVLERLQRLVARALSKVRAAGIPLRLANNNHSGLLNAEAPTWGSHENYLVERRPSRLTRRILPFLVTRVYGGAGGVLHPTGRFLAAVRPVFMQHDTGGGTTSHRAIHSTSRDENHMGPSPARFRYHLILGDGHRSHFNLALQLGATAVALKAIVFDRRLSAQLSRSSLLPRAGWVEVLQELNVLAEPGRPPRVHPLVVRVQRLYLDAARRYADLLREPPEWIERTLGDWAATLDAFERDDREWLVARLDAFTKHELFSRVLERAGRSWSDLAGDGPLFSELALIDHSYHAFPHEASAFDGLERAGLLRHRVTEPIEPGAEPEPFVPQTRTRARARARFLKQHAGATGLMADWSYVHDVRRAATATLHDPFAEDFAPWEAGGPPNDVPFLLFERLREARRRAAARAPAPDQGDPGYSEGMRSER
jgi:proteasome accessory factor A